MLIKGIKEHQRLLVMDHLACCHLKRGAEEEAQRMATRMVQMAPDRALGYLRLSRCVGQEGQAILRVGLRRVRQSERRVLEEALKPKVDCHFMTLPDLVLSQIASHLHGPDLRNLRLTCRAMSGIVSGSAKSSVTVIRECADEELKVPSHIRHLCLLSARSARLPRNLRSLVCEGSVNITNLSECSKLTCLVIIPSDYQPLPRLQEWAIRRWREGHLRLLAWWQLGLDPKFRMATLATNRCLLYERKKIERLLSKIKSPT